MASSTVPFSVDAIPGQETLAGPDKQSRPRGRPRKLFLGQGTLAELEIQPRPRGRPRKLFLGEETQPRQRGRPRKTPCSTNIATPASSTEETLEQVTLLGSESQQRKRARPCENSPESQQRKRVQSSFQTTFEHANDEAGLLEQSRKDLVDARVQFEDDRWLQKLRDSDLRAWCKPVTRDVQLETVQSFYKAMYDETTLAIRHCVVCGSQRAPVDLRDYIWKDFHPLYAKVEHLLLPSQQDHFQCRECFPRNNGNIAVCHDCQEALQRRRLPRACQVNMLQLKCQHRYPKELVDLSPLEERLIGLHRPCGWITKFQIDLDKGTSGRYRKLKKGHVTVFPNDVQGLCSNVLPHPLVTETENLHVCFVPPRKPTPKDIEFVLAVNPQRLKRALVWLKANNPLYSNIRISDHHLRSWGHSCPGTLVPQALFEGMVSYDHTVEDIIRTAHYVPSAERGGVDQTTLTAEEVLAQLEDRENSAAQMEAECNARLGTVYSRDLEENEMSPDQIEREVTELTSTGLMGTEMEGEYSVQERLRELRNMTIGPLDNQRRTNPNTSNTLVTEGNKPFIASRHGEVFADSNEAEFFPKAFPCLFPWGTGGPKNIITPEEEETAADDNEAGHGIDSDAQGSKNSNFSLRSWAKFLLQRHGK